MRFLILVVVSLYLPLAWSQEVRPLSGEHFSNVNLSLEQAPEKVRHLQDQYENVGGKAANDFCKKNGYKFRTAFYYTIQKDKQGAALEDVFCSNEKVDVNAARAVIFRTKKGLWPEAKKIVKKYNGVTFSKYKSTKLTDSKSATAKSETPSSAK